MAVEVQDDAGGNYAVDRLVSAIEAALVHLGRASWDVSVVLADDALLRALNRPWRGVDESTDVLAFPQVTFANPNRLTLSDADTLGDEEEATETSADRPPSTLGDIVISVETAQRQAVEFGHTLEDELLLLSIHALLHLVGYDHMDPPSAARMKDEERRLLNQVGGPQQPGLVQRGSLHPA